MDYFSSDKIIEPSKGDLLISEPYLPDPNFERTVILLCEHDENGSFGFVLNKQSTASLSELLDEAGSFDTNVFIGGPVQQNTLHFLHKPSANLKSDKKITDGIFWGIDFEGLLSLLNLNQISKNEIKFFVGYSGWSAGQLMEELMAKSWIVYKNTSPDLVFDLDPKELWKQVLADMGGKFRAISNYPIDPRLN